MYNFIIYWIIISLITFLLISHASRKFENYPMEVWDKKDWTVIILSSIIWIVGIFELFIKYVWPELIKE